MTHLATLVLALTFPGLPHFGIHRTKPAPPDTIPPVWHTASRLALESQLVRLDLPPLNTEASGLKLQVDPRTVRVTVDPDSGMVTAAPQVGEFQLAPGAQRTMADFSRETSAATFRRLWRAQNIAALNAMAAAAAQQAATPHGLQFNFPSPLPARIQSLLGPGGPALNVSGAENIKLSGQSNWTNQEVLGQRKSLFPTLDMQQDLDIHLDGQLSDRIKVNLLQNSANQIPLMNRIAINYRGGEDDLVQEFDLGNTNLSLPNTQYVSYSGKNEGLFGVKSALRYGPLDFTVLASKQEGRSERASYAGGASKQERTIADLDYVRGVYFFLYDPNNTATQAIDLASIRIYKDDYNYGNLSNKIRGRAMVNPDMLTATPNPNPAQAQADTASIHGWFTQLISGSDKDYDILNNVYGPNFPVIRLHQAVFSEQRLAVTYQYRNVDPNGVPIGPVITVGIENPAAPADSERIFKLIRPPQTALLPDSLGVFFEPNPLKAPINPTRELELKNFYDLLGQRIDPLSFTLSVQQGVDDPPLISVTVRDSAVDYIEVLGLDNLDESRGTPVRGHDRKVDGTQIATNTRTFVDYENGILFLPDLRPFAPRVSGPDARPFEKAIDSLVLFRRARLDSSLGASTAPNRAAYDKYNPRRDTDRLYYLDVNFTAQRASGIINLGRSNIMDGTEAVTVNGERWVRDRDYTIDYELGQVTLKRALGPSDNLSIDYSYAPLFQQASRTLLGSAFSLTGRDKSLGGAFLYESRGAQDLRPRIGEEPSRSLIADLNTSFGFKPKWMTQFVDHLPGIRTTTPSEMHFQGELGQSFPNPNTQNQVYVDDMEGIRDAVSLSMGPERWRWSSVPSLKDTVTNAVTSVLDPAVRDTLKDTEIHWFSPPRSVQERDLKPTLEDAQGAQNYRQVLCLSMPNPDSALASITTRLWAGLTYPLDAAGIDLSRSQFIELWVNDRVEPAIRDQHVRLHIDLGTVSEDEMRSPDVPPNGLLDTEDQSTNGVLRDNQLTVNGTINEDTGYDNQLDAKERADYQAGLRPLRHLVTASPDDPEGDDFRPPDTRTYKEIDPRAWLYTNGSENSVTVNPNPDTEDLNLNQNLDTQENYIEYTIDLGDTSSTNPYLATDLQKDLRAGKLVGHTIDSDNGWRRYRIPIGDPAAVRFGTPNLTLSRQLRLWVQGLKSGDPVIANGEHRPVLMLGSLDIVGSRWQASDLSDLAKAASTTLTLNTVSNIDNADIYTSPFTESKTRSGNQELTRREQSLSLEFTRLQPLDRIEVFKTFSIDEDYSRYGSLTWYIRGVNILDSLNRGPTDSLRYFVRFASDENEQNYYEVNEPVPSNWETASLRLTDISNLKLTPHFTDSLFRYEVPGSRTEYVIHGRPSFTRLRRISFGLLNRDTTVSYASGSAWFDEIRATNVAKDVGHAGRFSLSGNVANLARYNLSFDGRDADFLTVGQSRGSGSTSKNIAFAGSVDLHRFIEGTGIVLPFTYGYNDNSSMPRFSAGDDVVRTGALAAASENRSISRNWTASYSRVWSERSNPFLRATIGGITASMTQTQTDFHNPSTVGISRSTGAAVNYLLAPRAWWSFMIPGTKARFSPLPERIYWNYSVGTSSNFTREQVSPDGTTPRVLTNTEGRAAAIDLGADTRPFDFLHHHIEQHRNLSLAPPLMQQWGIVNFGAATGWRQTFDANISMNRGDWLRPTIAWNSGFRQNNGPELSSDLSVRAIDNNQSVRFSWGLPFDRLTLRAPAARDSGRTPTVSAWRRLLARIGSVSADAQFNQSSSYSRVGGVNPNLLYLVGLESNPGLGDRIAPLSGNTTTLGQDWRVGANTRISLPLAVFISTRGDYSARWNTSNGLSSRNENLHFPSFDLEYGKLAHALRLDRFLNNPQLRTSYDRTRGYEYANGALDPTNITTSTEWRPLLGISGDFKNNTRSELRIERRITLEDNQLVGNSLKTTRNTKVDLSLSRSYTQGQKVNFLGKESTVKSSVSIGGTMSYARDSGQTEVFNAGVRSIALPVLADRLALNGTGSYGFSNNVTGNLLLGFGQDRNLVLNQIHRNVVVELRASFTF